MNKEDIERIWAEKSDDELRSAFSKRFEDFTPEAHEMIEKEFYKRNLHQRDGGSSRSIPSNAPRNEGYRANNMVYCRGCGKQIHESARACPQCGAVQRTRQSKSKGVAAILAIFLGGLGIHRFYLGQWWGLLYLLLCWTFVPSIIAFIEGIVFLCTSDDAWDEKYG